MPATMSPAPKVSATAISEVSKAIPTVSLFNMKIHRVNMQQAIAQIKCWMFARQEMVPGGCRFVVTPNVDHAVLLQTNKRLSSAYSKADLVLADGHPVVWASRLLGKKLPERVPGSDLVPLLFSSLSQQERLRVFLLGAAPGVGLRAAANIGRRFAQVDIVGVYSPPLGFETKPSENENILSKIAEVRPDLVVIGLGAPKQECWIAEHCERVQAKVALCVGATIDFLAGEKKRAPVWMQRLGIEWLHRMLSEPKRLVKRYAKDAWVFPQLVFRQWRKDRTAMKS
ncbi:MAG TPA: WecB/TagA/CpsF family glycosyltransferase [Pirellulaceae bacterium]|nr:WecB/TagA/CpsF family glycosyltransferase [Pirellulaceae bacterium]HMO90633.1 WecB/TagA/CpsF family glycosyltransferase [Pirellulaceae bacterium]HMP67788.1 WecB/TagA/CpsF family glycosyltransferase [Pirellulaceae bacterium]